MRPRLIFVAGIAASFAAPLAAQPLPPPVAGGRMQIEATVGSETRFGQYDYQPPKPCVILAERLQRAHYPRSTRTPVPGVAGSVASTFTFNPNYAANHPEVGKPIRGVEVRADGAPARYGSIAATTHWDEEGQRTFKLEATAYAGSEIWLIEGKGGGRIFSDYAAPVNSPIAASFYSADLTRVEGNVGSFTYGLPLPYRYLPGINQYWTELQSDGTVAVFHAAHFDEPIPGIGVFYPIGAVTTTGTPGHDPGYQVDVEPLTAEGASTSLQAADWTFTGNFEPTNEPESHYRLAPDGASASKLRYKLQIQPGLARTITWSETFTPEGDGAPSDYRFLTEDVSAAATATQVHLIDPFESNPHRFGARPGIYRVVAFETESFDATLTADTNRDGIILPAGGPLTPYVIDRADTASGAQPYGLLFNVDDDDGDAVADYANATVDGPADLADFAPVFLNIKQLLVALPPGAVCKLSQADSALNFVYTDLKQATAFTYLTDPRDYGYGPAFDQSAASAAVQPITAAGVELSADFVDRIRYQNQGVILVEARAATTLPLILTVETGTGIAIVSLPLRVSFGEIAVDANRDGVIKLASEDASDATTDATPFRFWLNEGVDGPGANGEETAEPGSFGTEHDYQHDRIRYKRDLEDWTRIKLSIPASLVPSAAVPPNETQSGIAIRLEWNSDLASPRQTPPPALKFVAAVDGTKNYLKEAAAADRQIAGDQGEVIGQVDADGRQCQLPAALWKNAENETLEANLLFEGAAPGQGRLVMAVYRDGQRLGEVGPVTIEIRPMQDLYEHWTANANDTDARGAAISATAVHPVGDHPASFEFTEADSGLSLPSDPEGNEYILFVHGWRMKPFERRVFAETAAKRLYQLGYRGKFGLFSWPTEWVDFDLWYAAIVNALADPQHYDRSEVVARASGNGPFAILLVNLRQRFGAGHVHIFAHSMGNVVVSEALRGLLQTPDGPFAAQYVACQSAEVASAYDPAIITDTSSSSPILGGPDRYTYSPDFMRASTESDLTAGNNYHNGVAGRLGAMRNFFNRADSALSSWRINQDLKPDNSIWQGDTTFSYDSVEVTSTNPHMFRDRYEEDPPGLDEPNKRRELNWEAVPDRYRILAFVVEARSMATGATAGVKGEFQGIEVDLNGSDYSFDKIHSAEFLGDTITARKFYQQLMNTFDIKKYEAQ